MTGDCSNAPCDKALQSSGSVGSPQLIPLVLVLHFIGHLEQWHFEPIPFRHHPINWAFIELSYISTLLKTSSDFVSQFHHCPMSMVTKLAYVYPSCMPSLPSSSNATFNRNSTIAASMEQMVQWGGRIDKGKLYSCLTADLTFAQIDLQENYSLPYFTPHLAWGLRDHPC